MPYDLTEDLKHFQILKNKSEILYVTTKIKMFDWPQVMGSLIEKIGSSGSKKLAQSIENELKSDIVGFRCLDGIRIFHRTEKKGFVVGNPFGPAEITFCFNDYDGPIGSICYFLNGEATRADITQPVFISHQGHIEWTNEKGQWHRIGGPALISPKKLSWYENHKLIRTESR